MRDRSFFFNSRSRARALKARFSEAHAREKISEGMREERDGASSRGACFSFSLSLHAFFRMGDTRRIHLFLGSVFSSPVSLWSSSKIFKNSFFFLLSTTLNATSARLARGKKYLANDKRQPNRDIYRLPRSSPTDFYQSLLILTSFIGQRW